MIDGIHDACIDVLDSLELTRLDVDSRDHLKSVACISSNSDEEIGEIITQAIEAVGQDGPISVENAKGFKTQLEIVEGTVIDRGYLSPYFSTDQTRGIAELEKPLIFIYNQNVTTAKSILPVLERAANESRPLLIVANDVSSEALKTLVLNKVKGAVNVCAIKAPEFGAVRTQTLQDLATVCGAEVFAVDLSDSNAGDLDQKLGTAEKVLVDKHGTLLIGTPGDKDKIRERIEACSESLDDPGLSDSERLVFQRRIRRLSDGVAIIRVGGSTEVEMFERRDRVDDALCASKSAKKSGIQPGGGSALVYASKSCYKKKSKSHSESYNAGYDVFLKSCQAPMRQIIENAGEVPEVILNKIHKSKTCIGYNASNGKFGNMIDMKIIDPHDVVKSAVTHATSVACNILSIGCAISLEEGEQNGLGLIENL